MSKIILFDGGNYMFKAIFSYKANPAVPMTYTYCKMLIGDLKKVKVEADDMIIVAQDFARSWRKNIDKNYKAQRKAKREDSMPPEQWDEIFKDFNQFFEKLAQSLPWYFISVLHCESDDIASVVSRYYKNKEVILLSSDRDWEMLLSLPNTKLFSPISKKFKKVPNPMKVLLEKIQGDVSDNLLEKPTSEAEYDKRKKIVDLIHELPDFVENAIKDELVHLLPKNLYTHKLPYKSLVADIEKIYKIGEQNA